MKVIKHYDNEFKVNAVKLIKESGVTLKRVSEDLGVAKSTLHKWVRAMERGDLREAFPGKGHLRPADAELKALRREVEILRQERDILKKAAAIFLSGREKNTRS